MRKRLAVCLIVAVLMISLAPQVLAAGNASLRGPGVVRAGDQITLTFYAGGGILGGSGTVVFDPSQLTLQGYTAQIGGSWVVEFSGNRFVFYDNLQKSPITGTAAIFSATFRVNAALETGTALSVSVAGVTLSNGQQDMNLGSAVYSTNIARPLSGNCNLASLTVDSVAISPVFSSNVTQYSASVPFEVSSLNVVALAEDANAKVSVYNPQLEPGATTTLQITVTAENGATKSYFLYVSRAQDPNYVPSNNSRLKSLTVADHPLSPAFDPEVKRYYIWLPYELDAVSVTAEVEDSKAGWAIAKIPELVPGKAADVVVSVKAEDGSTSDYVITVFRAPAHEDTDEFLYGPKETEPAPTETTAPPETTLPPETTVPTTTAPETVPETTYPQEIKEPAARVEVVWVVLMMLVALAAGVGIGMLLKTLADKKKHA